MENLEGRLLSGIRDELIRKSVRVGDINFIGEIVEADSIEAMKKLCFDFKNILENHVVILCASIGGKPSVALSIDENISKMKNLDAGKIVKENISQLIKGGWTKNFCYCRRAGFGKTK